MEHDHRQQRQEQGVRAVPAQVLAQRHLDRADQHRRDPREQRRAAVRDPPCSGGSSRRGADRPDQDQQLRQRQRMPRRLRALADRQRSRQTRPAALGGAPRARPLACRGASGEACARQRSPPGADQPLARVAGPRAAALRALPAASERGRRLRERPPRPLLRFATAPVARPGFRPGFAAPHRRRC